MDGKISGTINESGCSVNVVNRRIAEQMKSVYNISVCEREIQYEKNAEMR